MRKISSLFDFAMIMYQPSIVLRDNRNRAYNITLDDLRHDFKQTIINALRVRKKPESFKHTLVAFISRDITTSEAFRLEITQTHVALDPLTGNGVEIGFSASATFKDDELRFGEKAVDCKAHHNPTDVRMFDICSYCLVSQRSDDQYYILT